MFGLSCLWVLLSRGLHGLGCVLQLQPSIPIPAARKQEVERGTASPVKDTSQEVPIPSVSIPLTRNWFHGLNIQKEGSKCHLYCEIHASSRLLEVLSLWKERRVGSGGRLATLGAVPTLWPLHCVNDSVHERNTCLLKTTGLLHTIHLGSRWQAYMSSSWLVVATYGLKIYILSTILFSPTSGVWIR